MPDFTWRAIDPSGRLSSGVSAAPSRAELLAQLHAQRLVPVEVNASESGINGPLGADGTVSGLGASDGRNVKLRPGRIQPADIFHFTAELAIMLRSGLALDNALRLLVEMSAKAAMAQLQGQILDAVKNGASLSKALAAYPQHFQDFYINMVRSGEASGQLAAVLERLVEHMDRLRQLRESVISASIYPAILLFVAIISLVAMLGFVVPQFEDLFADLGDGLPLATQWVVAIGQVFKHHWAAITLSVALLAWLGQRWARSSAGRRRLHQWVLRLPLLGRLALKFQLTLFARTLGTLVGNGVPLLKAVQIASDTVSNSVVKQALSPMPGQLKSGVRVTESFRQVGLFDPLAINLVKVGEETGRLGPMLLELANLYNRDVEQGIKRSLTLLEPVLILVLGGLIAAIIVAILLGILSVNDLAL